MFSTQPAAFSSSFKLLDELPISTLPPSRDSIPAEDPVNSAVTLTPGYFSIKASATALASFSIDVDPAIAMLPERSAFVSVVASAASSVAASVAASVASSVAVSVAVASAVVSAALLPHPVNKPAATVAAISTVISLFFFIFFLLHNESPIFRAAFFRTIQ